MPSRAAEQEHQRGFQYLCGAQHNPMLHSSLPFGTMSGKGVLSLRVRVAAMTETAITAKTAQTVKTVKVLYFVGQAQKDIKVLSRTVKNAWTIMKAAPPFPTSWFQHGAQLGGGRGVCRVVQVRHMPLATEACAQKCSHSNLSVPRPCDLPCKTESPINWWKLPPLHYPSFYVHFAGMMCASGVAQSRVLCNRMVSVHGWDGCWSGCRYVGTQAACAHVLIAPPLGDLLFANIYACLGNKYSNKKCESSVSDLKPAWMRWEVSPQTLKAIKMRWGAPAPTVCSFCPLKGVALSLSLSNGRNCRLLCLSYKDKHGECLLHPCADKRIMTSLHGILKLSARVCTAGQCRIEVSIDEHCKHEILGGLFAKRTALPTANVSDGSAGTKQDLIL